MDEIYNIYLNSSKSIYNQCLVDAFKSRLYFGMRLVRQPAYFLLFPTEYEEILYWTTVNGDCLENLGKGIEYVGKSKCEEEIKTIYDASNLVSDTTSVSSNWVEDFFNEQTETYRQESIQIYRKVLITSSLLFEKTISQIQLPRK